MPHPWRFGRALVVALALGFTSGHFARAADFPSENGNRFSLKGFGTLGLARSDDDSNEYVRDLLQPDGLGNSWSGKIDSLIGLQAGYHFDDQLEGVFQAVSRYRYDGSYDPEISWAFLGYEPAPNINLRLGRLGTEFYMQADSRLIGYANLTVRPPPDFFGTLVFSYFDGVDAAVTTPVGNGLLRGKMFVGISPESTPFVKGVTWNVSGSTLIGGYLDYYNEPWQIRLSHDQVRFARELPLNRLAGFDVTDLVPELSTHDKWVYYDSLGLAYDKGPVQVQLMLSQTEHDSEAYEDTKAGYIIAGYRMGDWTPYLGYSWAKSRASRLTTPLPPDSASAVIDLTRATHSDQHTWFIGARWDIRQNLALKAQVDWVHGAHDSAFLFRDDNIYWDGKMTVYSLGLDFVF